MTLSDQSASADWRDVPLDDPRVVRVVDALILHSKSLGDTPQTWRAAQIAVWALGPDLRKYVRHLPDCACERDPRLRVTACTCGLADRLAFDETEGRDA